MGLLDLDDRFRLRVGAQAVELEVDASFEFFDIPALGVRGKAAVDDGRQTRTGWCWTPR